MRRNRDFIGPAGMGGTVALWGASSLIQSVQHISIAVSGTSSTTTIASVDPTRSVVIHLGESTAHNTGNSVGSSFQEVAITNATTVTGSRNSSSGFTNTVNAVVIEFMPGVLRSLQSFRVTIGAVTSATATITEVLPAKTLLVPRGINSSDSGTSWEANLWQCRMTLTNSTTVTGTHNTAGANFYYVNGTALEFF